MILYCNNFYCWFNCNIHEIISLAVKTTEVIGKILTDVAFETTFITVGLTGITVESTGNRFMFPLLSKSCQCDRKNCKGQSIIVSIKN